MKYKVKLETTVEAANAEAAEQMVFGQAADSAGEVEIEAIPTKEWNVNLQVTPVLTFSVSVNAESGEEAKAKAYELVEDEAFCGSGISGMLEMADNDDYEIGDLDIEAHDAIPVDDEEDIDSAAPATEISAA